MTVTIILIGLDHFLFVLNRDIRYILYKLPLRGFCVNWMYVWKFLIWDFCVWMWSSQLNRNTVMKQSPFLIYLLVIMVCLCTWRPVIHSSGFRLLKSVSIRTVWCLLSNADHQMHKAWADGCVRRYRNMENWERECDNVRQLVSLWSRAVLCHTKPHWQEWSARLPAPAAANPVSIKHRLPCDESLILNKPRALLLPEPDVSFGLCNWGGYLLMVP